MTSGDEQRHATHHPPSLHLNYIMLILVPTNYSREEPTTTVFLTNRAMSGRRREPSPRRPHDPLATSLLHRCSRGSRRWALQSWT